MGEQLINKPYARLGSSIGESPSSRSRVAITRRTAVSVKRKGADPAVWYYRTISEYVASPEGQEAVKGYEIYPGVRDLDREGRSKSKKLLLLRVM